MDARVAIVDHVGVTIATILYCTQCHSVLPLFISLFLSKEMAETVETAEEAVTKEEEKGERDGKTEEEKVKEFMQPFT